MRQVLLALALRDDDVGGAEAAELADRALELVPEQPAARPAGGARGGEGQLSGRRRLGAAVNRRVELRGLEPLTFALPARRSPS